MKITYEIARTIKTDNYGEYHEYAIIIDGVPHEFHDEDDVRELVRLLNEGAELRALADEAVKDAPFLYPMIEFLKRTGK